MKLCNMSLEKIKILEGIITSRKKVITKDYYLKEPY